MDYIEMLDREFGRAHRIPREKIEEVYNLALNELKDPMNTYLAVLGLISELVRGTTVFDYSSLSKDTIKEITLIIKA